MSLVCFQNSGYVPLLLVTALFTGQTRQTLFVYIFLFGIGFDLMLWTLGVWLLTQQKAGKVELRNLLNLPFAATVFSLLLIFFGWHQWIPQTILTPIKLFGDCALPVAVMVVGGNLAGTNLVQIEKREISLLILTKLVLMPTVALFAILKFHVEYLLGYFILLEAASPSAVSLSVIARHYRTNEKFINRGIFFSHVLSVITIPVYLTLYAYLANSL